MPLGPPPSVVLRVLCLSDPSRCTSPAGDRSLLRMLLTLNIDRIPLPRMCSLPVHVQRIIGATPVKQRHTPLNAARDMCGDRVRVVQSILENRSEIPKTHEQIRDVAERWLDVALLDFKVTLLTFLASRVATILMLLRRRIDRLRNPPDHASQQTSYHLLRRANLLPPTRRRWGSTIRQAWSK
ncbi:hypothetical protein DL93DRAFT_486266 [Clavulina sp. PMI_390]|nr:hypothetical protein DL93DRAFT_486266 [Clavulina sp. PMI_390]